MLKSTSSQLKVVMLSVVLFLSGCGTKPGVLLVIGDSELEQPAIKCPEGTVCEVDLERVTYSKGYMNKVMKTFNRCVDQEKR